MYHYKFIFFNSMDGFRNKSYPDGYNTICAHDLYGSEDVEVVETPLYYASSFVRNIYGFHNSKSVNNKVRLPFKSLWYPHYFKSKSGNKPFCFIILQHNLPIEYLQWLKKRYPDCRIVLMHRDLKKVCLRANPQLPDNPVLDLEMSYDKGESKQYGYPWFSEYESKIDIPVSETPESDVFFGGRVKDRLPKIMEAYKVFRAAGMKVFFYLTGVPEESRKPYEGIVYSDHNMSYKEMLIHTVNTRCVLEINQGNADGYTSRFLESVIYGKRLVTNNQSIKDSPFYKSGHIQVVNEMSEINTDVLKSGNGFVDYQYKGEFSPFRMIDRVDEELIKKYGAPGLKK